MNENLPFPTSFPLYTWLHSVNTVDITYVRVHVALIYICRLYWTNRQSTALAVLAIVTVLYLWLNLDCCSLQAIVIGYTCGLLCLKTAL